MDEILLTPGPTPLPSYVREALARPIIHHRTDAYRAIFRRVAVGLPRLFQTAAPVFTLTGSGTAAMEAAVVNLLSPGEEAIVLLGGKFAERWQHLCEAYHIRAVTVPVAYGEAVDPAQVAETLTRYPAAKVILATLTETSTGVVHDLEALGRIAREQDRILVADAISGLGADACRTDAWGVDVVVAASQKGLMLPPGLGFISVNERAWRCVERSRSPRYYNDLRLYREAAAGDDAPFTSAIPLVMALDLVLAKLNEEGLEPVWERTATLAASVRAGAARLGLSVFARRPSNALTAIAVPGAKRVIEAMHARGVRVAAGQGELAGKIIRIAHMGHITNSDVQAGLKALGQALAQVTTGAQA